ncbi:NAD(P)H-dependent oxidoreductase [Roseomonas sp. GC11]|uniref:NADPH-dependent FMN reductase n=1 Tax=Roseomonas sp. GC11 TaxID=2950546 RepID=UPI00210BB525|nr:NAD(P)H-dependent oxidoreductase [Roseomonas sp. GC11]MCQ4162393.1 NAD(P)H-dependent oxidoreductase [Roseomonas sp. GC11]
MSQPRILVLAASLRGGSLNRRLAELFARRVTEQGGQATLPDLRDYAMPLYDGDIEQNEGIPATAKALHQVFAGHQGIFIASPEYNSALSPLLVNILSWVSRVKDNGGQGAAFGTPVYALGSASPGGFGGYRGLVALRGVLELGLGARVLPQMVSVPAAHQAFDEAGELTTPAGAMVGTLAGQLLKAVG